MKYIKTISGSNLKDTLKKKVAVENVRHLVSLHVRLLVQ